MTPYTTDEARAALAIVQAVAETIRELREVPSGHLYASLMGRLTLDQYNRVIGLLKRSGLVEEPSAHLLRWVEPVTPPES